LTADRMARFALKIPRGNAQPPALLPPDGDGPTLPARVHFPRRVLHVGTERRRRTSPYVLHRCDLAHRYTEVEVEATRHVHRIAGNRLSIHHDIGQAVASHGSKRDYALRTLPQPVHERLHAEGARQTDAFDVLDVNQLRDPELRTPMHFFQGHNAARPAAND